MRARNRPPLRLVAIAWTALLLTACASTPPEVQRDVVTLKGDSLPAVTSKDVLAGDFSDLSEGETIIIGTARDGTGVISQPAMAEITITESVLNASQFDRSLLMQRCDPDGDGIIDTYCPELISAMRDGLLGNEKFVLLQSQYGVSRTPLGKAQVYPQGMRINVAEEPDKRVPLALQSITVNRGNKAFSGDLSFIVNIPPQLTMGSIESVSLIQDQTDTRAMLLLIPYVNFIALGMGNFRSVAGDVQFQTDRELDGKTRLVMKNVNLEPGQGIDVRFSASYAIAN